MTYRSPLTKENRIARRIARRLVRECGVVFGELIENYCILVDRQAVAINHGGGMDYWQWSLRVDTGDHYAHPKVLSVNGKPLPDWTKGECEIGGVMSASRIARSHAIGITRCERTGNIEVTGGDRP